MWEMWTGVVNANARCDSLTSTGDEMFETKSVACCVVWVVWVVWRGGGSWHAVL